MMPMFCVPQLNKQCLEIVTVKFLDQKCGFTKRGKKRKQSVGFSNRPCSVFNWREVTTKTITQTEHRCIENKKELKCHYQWGCARYVDIIVKYIVRNHVSYNNWMTEQLVIKMSVGSGH